MNNIKNLEELLKDTLEKTKKIQETKICILTQPGDNYGSLMLQLDIILNNENTNKEEILALVVKKIPTNEMYQKIFKIQVTFKKEVALYNTIVPALKQFVQESSNGSLDFFPKYYASRFNLNEDDGEVDEDGVLILENLKASGYSNLDRKIGFDLDAAKLLLKDLAIFHATSLALRLRKPAVFAEKIKPFCIDDTFTGSRYVILNAFCRDFVAENPQTAHVAHKINFLNAANKQLVNDMYGTIIHFDLWTNNVMVKFDNVNKIIGTKLVDFQVYHYGSPASDLFFFIWTSVQENVLKKNLDDLIKYYHVNFVKTLEDLKCDSSSYTIESLYKEIKFHSKFEFGHAFFFRTFVIYNDQKEEGATPEDMIKKVSQGSKEKGWFMVLECEKRGWLPLVA